VTLDYNDLIANENLSLKIKEAFGVSGLGVLTVKNVPNLPTYRAALLPIAREFVNKLGHSDIIVCSHLAPGVPLLADRWNSTQDFGEFTIRKLMWLNSNISFSTKQRL
jgi:hypothetical protein